MTWTSIPHAVPSPDDIDYELLYSGSNSSGITLTYREYTSSGMARQAFYQTLTYPPGATQIAFRGFRFEVERAGADAITFKVVSDRTPAR